MYPAIFIPFIPGITKNSLSNRFVSHSVWGHVDYLSTKVCQRQVQDSDPWWAWNRILQWLEQQRKE